MDEVTQIKKDLERTRIELGILYEISNALYTTLKMDEILYIILTGVTAHAGLGFNRAMLFLMNESENVIEGKMAIGPESGEHADRIWSEIKKDNKDLDDLISVYHVARDELVETGLTSQVRHIRFPVSEDTGGLLARCITEGMPLHLTSESIHRYADDPLIRLLKSTELIIVPLKSKSRVNGAIIADNFVTGKTIGKDDIRMLIMLANQAGLAIENSRLYEQTVIRAHKDYLTDIWNHGYFQTILQSELEKSRTDKTPLSLLMIDIDDFKLYNDKLGHQAGDHILKEMAALLKNQSRKMDYVCRYGGEEFSMLLPQTEKKEALLIAERIRTAIGKHSFMHPETLAEKQLTVSIGLSTFPGDGDTPSKLISASDKKLYQAKHSGKNTTCS